LLCRPRADTPSHSHTRTILILSVIIIGTVIAVQLSVQDIVPSPRISFDQHDQPKPLPPAFAVNASCENTKPTAKVTKLSQTLFPVSSPKTTDSWVGENHKMLRALFRCMELSDCGPNQQKGTCCISNLSLVFALTLISRYIVRALFPSSV
jgi:hypothetical protein